MSKSAKILLGILTLLPIVGMGFYILAFFKTFAEISHQTITSDGINQTLPFDFFRQFFSVAIWAILSGLLSIGLLIYYIIHVVNNKIIDGNERLVWILVFIFAGMIGFPIYWYMRIWQEHPGETSTTNTPYN
ncbi:MAG: hypothetical protein QM802_17260 [Agriterribacter sp.]